jgi:hypothetical protein
VSENLNHSYVSPNISDPPGSPPNDARRSEAQNGGQTPIALLAVPRAWTRLVVAAVTLLFLVVGLVAFMVYLNFRTVEQNRVRIEELQQRMAVLECVQTGRPVKVCQEQAQLGPPKP